MTRGRLLRLWRDLSSWQRLLCESAFCVLIAPAVEALISGSSADYVEAVIGGLFLGMLFAITDHAFSSTSRRGRERRRGERHHG
jgi:Na+-translocating ferredoxin:NAD+ oxidoreductase RnfD subunit